MRLFSSKTLILLSSVFYLPAHFPAQAMAAEVLHLNNGDKLSGEIKTYTPGRVDIKTKYGFFQIPIKDLGGVETPNTQKQQDILRFMKASAETQKQRARKDIQQQIQPTPVPRALPKAEPKKAEPKKTNLQKTEIVTNAATPSQEVKENLFLGAKWSGNANAGAELKTGNSEQNGLNADVTIGAKWEKHRATLKADYNREEDDGDVTVDNRALSLGHDYFFSKKWFINNQVSFEQDDIDQLDLRLTASSGLGYQAFEQDDLNLKFVLGPGYQFEEFEDGSEDKSITARFATDYDQKFYDDLFRLFHEHVLTSPADDFEAFLFQSESGIRVPLKKGIIASGQVDFDWDNDPAEGTTEDDTTYSLKLGYEW